MKFFTMIWVVLMAILVSVPVMAQDKLNAFSTKEACLNAMQSGNFSFYEPKFFGLKDKQPVDGKTKVSAQLESNACVSMLTVSGIQWVPQERGTTLRFWRNTDGTLGYAYARDDCGNPVYEIAYPSSSDQPSSDQQTTTPATQQQQIDPVVLAQAIVLLQKADAENCPDVTHVLAQEYAGDHHKKNTQARVECKGVYDVEASTLDFKPSKPASSNGGGEGFWHRFWDEPAVVGVPVEYGYGGYNTGWGGGYNRNWNSGNRGNNHGGGHSGGSGGSAGTGNAH